MPPSGLRPVALHHHLHELVAHAPGGVVGDAELAVQRHRRASLLALGHEVDALEPHRERELRRLEDGPGGNGGLAVAAIALLELVCGQLAVSVVAAVRAHEAFGPAPAVEGVEALLFGAVEGEELVEADALLLCNRSGVQARGIVGQRGAAREVGSDGAAAAKAWATGQPRVWPVAGLALRGRGGVRARRAWERPKSRGRCRAS